MYQRFYMGATLSWVDPWTFDVKSYHTFAALLPIGSNGFNAILNYFKRVSSYCGQKIGCSTTLAIHIHFAKRVCSWFNRQQTSHCTIYLYINEGWYQHAIVVNGFSNAACFIQR